MRLDAESGRGRGEGPPPMDESWWAAVLREEHTEKGAPRRQGPPPGSGCPQGTPEDWAWARRLYDSDDTIELHVIGHNRGGLLVEARNLRGFVPASHIVGVEAEGDEALRAASMAALVGTPMLLKVIEYDPERGRIVFSQRAALAGPGRRAALLADLAAGQRVRGPVTNLTRFGAFVDLGGVEGLIHVSEISWSRVQHPADALACGQEVEVLVLSVDREQSRVALSLKRLLPDPWDTVEQRFQVGQIVEGVITNVVKFGAFVCVGDGLEGLVHVSELGDGDFLHPRGVAREGESVRARIIHIDGAARRLGLSLREIPQPPALHSGMRERSEVVSSV